jgi:beta-glucosidase
MKSLQLIVVLILLLNFFPQTQSPKKDIYHSGWIDLNKNGRMDVYENPKIDIERRITDLISQMTLEEKTCQTATLYGYNRVLKDELPTPDWKNQIWKDGIANIDEHLNGWGPGSKSIYATDLEKHVWAMNETQRFFIEETRLGIPADFTNEGLRGVAAPIATSFPSESGLGHTWDTELVREVGRITAREARALGYTNIYAPYPGCCARPTLGTRRRCLWRRSLSCVETRR